jgi:hypothetical protein
MTRHACACWWTQRACAGGVCEGWLPPRLVPRHLELHGNAISVLPAGIFDQLTSLGWVRERGWEGVWGHGRRGGSVWENVLRVVILSCAWVCPILVCVNVCEILIWAWICTPVSCVCTHMWPGAWKERGTLRLAKDYACVCAVCVCTCVCFVCVHDHWFVCMHACVWMCVLVNVCVCGGDCVCLCIFFFVNMYVHIEPKTLNHKP